MNCDRPTVAAYLRHVLEDGDTANDWLGHLTPDCAAAIESVGRLLAALLGA